ncbi:hypothetical protein D3H55_02610 [Bacillus salacetis]|uniref:DUF2524 family protein n=1 Tax=Bacillus salacetis TaxID=2315464 RepID=A0A3A1R5H3_9BACI|nr:hypothetical protein [Bacillus salacetis]RIW38446.1 hypothetical protein D3H55_02610 [Bacillus salacetis]
MDSLKEALQQVEIAERNLLDAQGNTDPQHFQRATQDVHYAQTLLNSIHDTMLKANQEDQKEYHRAQERMRLLEEALASL